MNFRFPRIVLALLTLPFVTARAEDFSWPGHGVISFDVPPGWSLRGIPAGEVGFVFKAMPDSAVSAVLQISLMNLRAARPVQAEELKENLLKSVQSYVSGSVEKKAVPQPLRLRQGSGWYVQFTDASLVGQPPVPGDYKMMRNGLLALDDRAVVVVTMQFDDPTGPAPADMLAMVGSMNFQRGATSAPAAPANVDAGSLTLKEANGNFELTVPEGKVLLKIPQNGLAPTSVRVGGATDSPRYFELVRSAPNLIVSGWFEAGSRYKGLDGFWASESKGLTRAGLSPTAKVEFLKCGEWEVVAYEIPLPASQFKLTNVNLRAELVRAGTWIDLHLSVTSDQTVAAARDQMLAALRAMQVSEK